jgi:hypothetical protein
VLLAGGAVLAVAVLAAAVALGVGGFVVSGRLPDEPAPEEPAEAIVVSGSERHEIQEALQAAASAGGGLGCDAEGPIVATVELEPTGAVRSVTVDPGWLRGERTSCVTRAISGLSGPTSSRARRARVALVL